MQNILEVDIKGYKAELPVLPLPSGVKIAFFNLHGNTKMTKHCADELAKLLDGCEVLLTAESKGLQLTHCIADKLGQDFYAVAAQIAEAVYAGRNKRNHFLVNHNGQGTASLPVQARRRASARKKGRHC